MIYVRYLSIVGSGKVLGLIRDLLLLWNIGLGIELDNFYFYLIFPSLTMSFLMPVLYLNLVPQISKELKGAVALSDRSFLINAILSNGFIFSLFAFIFLIVGNFTFSFLIKNEVQYVFLLMCTMPAVFSLVSEYCSSILTATGNIGPIFVGNIIINLPIILLFLLIDVSIEIFLSIYVISFLFRMLYLLFHVYKSCAVRPRFIYGNYNVQTLSFKNFVSSSAGPSAQACILIGRAFCSLLPDGATGMYYYGMKVFEIIYGTVGLVVGTKFFSEIQSLSIISIFKRLRIISYINFCICILTYVSVLILENMLDKFSFYTEYNINIIFQYSIYSLPLIFLLPLKPFIFEKSQKELQKSGEFLMLHF